MSIHKNKLFKLKLLLIVSVSINLKVQSQTIPNGSFENWTTITVGADTVLTADNWNGSYTQGSNPLSPIRTTDHVDGNYGIELETTQWPIVGKTGGIASCIFPLSNKPIYLNGFFKSHRVDTTGTGQVLIWFKNNNNKIGEALFTTNATVSNYTPFSIPINYTSNLIPDEATIWLCSEGIFGVNTKNFGNKLWIDNLTLSDAPLSIKENINKKEYFILYPNPANDNLNISLTRHSYAKLRITNLIGETLLAKELNEVNCIINIETLQSGILFLEIEIDKRIFVEKIIKE